MLNTGYVLVISRWYNRFEYPICGTKNVLSFNLKSTEFVTFQIYKVCRISIHDLGLNLRLAYCNKIIRAVFVMFCAIHK